MKHNRFLTAAVLGMTLCASPLLMAQPAPSFTPAHLPSAQRLDRVTAEAETPVPTVRSASGVAAPTQQYSHGDPTANEQYLLEMINRARANPTAEGVRLAGTTDPDVLMAYAYFNVDTTAVRQAFAGYPARAPLAFNSMLIAAARGHSADMRANNFQGHTGSNGSTFDQRINAAGYTGWTNAGENVAAYARSMWYAHAGFNVDWGVPNLGHRSNIMNFEADAREFIEIGLGVEDIGSDPPQGRVGRYIVTELFGRRGATRYIVGVVYRDANRNGFYDPGEGVGGVRIEPSVGDWFAVTSASGGYAIPVTTAGSVTVTATGGLSAGTVSISTNVVLAGSNVKVDFVLPPPPAAPTLVLPAANATINGTNITFTWNAPAGTVRLYTFELSTDPSFATLVLRDSTVTPPTFFVERVNPGVSYYWRVKAGNEGGWGPYSEARRFVTSTSSVENEADANAAQLAVSPQPVTDRVTVRLSLRAPSDVDLTIVDAAGRSVHRVFNGRAGEGDSHFAVDLSSLSSGVYFVQCETAAGRTTSPLVVRR